MRGSLLLVNQWRDIRIPETSLIALLQNISFISKAFPFLKDQKRPCCVLCPFLSHLNILINSYQENQKRDETCISQLLLISHSTLEGSEMFLFMLLTLLKNCNDICKLQDWQKQKLVNCSTKTRTKIIRNGIGIFLNYSGWNIIYIVSGNIRHVIISITCRVWPRSCTIVDSSRLFSVRQVT